MVDHRASEPPNPEAGLFGLTLTPDESGIVLISVPWEPTASYGRSTSLAPAALIPASHQLDLFDLYFNEPWKAGITMLPPPAWMLAESEQLAERIDLEREAYGTATSRKLIDDVNISAERVRAWVKQTAAHWIEQGKTVGVVGGDHSTPLGLIEALGDRSSHFGILHIDAHLDLRIAYEGFEFSHASIMYNVLRRVGSVNPIVHVGVRDFSYEEYQMASASDGRCIIYDDRMLHVTGGGMAMFASEIVESLPDEVYVSFDIDGLDPALCPHTGTPVPGGLNYHEVQMLFEALANSGKRVIGFDLCEVGVPGKSEWDLNVASRVLYKLCGLAEVAKSKTGEGEEV